MSGVEEIKKCRVCGSEKLKFIISLGNQYVTNFIESESEQEGIPKCPLDLVLCEKCNLLQLKHNAPPESMWNDQYWYKSGISSTIKNDLNDVASNALKMADTKERDIVVDIGCNDGTLLEFYKKFGSGLDLVGFEPSKNVAREASGKGFRVINNFFNAESFKREFGGKKAKIITAISMFYDLEDPNKFLSDIKSVLDPKGLFIIQQNYLMTMLENNAFDNICHEHREYYSLLSLKSVLERHGMEIFDVSFSDINGGSIRTYIKLAGNENLGSEESKKRVADAEEVEISRGLNEIRPYIDFARRIEKIKKDVLGFIKSHAGKRVWIYGASTRGNVLLQYFGLDGSMVECIADKNEDKWGKMTVGTLIPIESPEKMREANPDFLMVNTWHFFSEIKNQEKEWFDKGGRFVLPLPEFRIVGK